MITELTLKWRIATMGWAPSQYQRHCPLIWVQQTCNTRPHPQIQWQSPSWAPAVYFNPVFNIFGFQSIQRMKRFQFRLLPLVVELQGWSFEGPPYSIWGEGGDSANWSRVALISPEVECSLVMSRDCKWSEGEIKSGLWMQSFGLSIFSSLYMFGHLF